MKKIILASLIALSLNAFAEPEPFKPTRHEDQFTMRINEYNTVKRLREACADLGAQTNYNEGGCAVFDNVTKSCTIYVLKLKNSEDRDEMGLWGHELAHCKYGKYHSVDGE